MCTHFFGRLREKLADENGETLVETLVSTLILAAVMLMLCTAIVAAAKANAAIRPGETVIDANKAVEVQGVSVGVSSDSGDSGSYSVSSYAENGLIYYELASS